MVRTISAASLAALLCVVYVVEPARADKVAITVTPLVTEMRVQPGQAGRVRVVVTNDGDMAERVMVQPVDWRTELDGSISIQRVGAEGVSSLAFYLSVSAYQFILQPGETRDVSLTLSLPSGFSNQPRSYWGGYFLKATPASAPPSQIGPGATVFVYDDVGEPRRHLTMQTLQVLPTGNGAARVLARLRNDGEGYLRLAGALLIERNGRVVKRQSVPVSAIFPGLARTIQVPLDGLAPGSYQIELTFDFGGPTIVDGVTTAKIR